MDYQAKRPKVSSELPFNEALEAPQNNYRMFEPPNRPRKPPQTAFYHCGCPQIPPLTPPLDPTSVLPLRCPFHTRYPSGLQHNGVTISTNTTGSPITSTLIRPNGFIAELTRLRALVDVLERRAESGLTDEGCWELDEHYTTDGVCPCIDGAEAWQQSKFVTGEISAFVQAYEREEAKRVKQVKQLAEERKRAMCDANSQLWLQSQADEGPRVAEQERGTELAPEGKTQQHGIVEQRSGETDLKKEQAEQLKMQQENCHGLIALEGDNNTGQDTNPTFEQLMSGVWQLSL